MSQNQTIETIQKWKLMDAMVRHLGADGQSSDESDDGGGYTATLPEWRAENVSQLLEYCDDHRKPTTEEGKIRPGTIPRERARVDSPTKSGRPAPQCLPENLYNAIWYQSLPRTAQEALHAQNPISLPRLRTVQT